MNIDCGWKNAQIGDICAGTLVYSEGKFYIVTNTSPDINPTTYCVDVDEGRLVTLADDRLVSIIEDAVLKIGGYYK